jgi:hypothetical protein
MLKISSSNFSLMMVFLAEPIELTSCSQTSKSWEPVPEDMEPTTRCHASDMPEDSPAMDNIH